MTDVVTKPDTRPDKPCFSSGPCAKRPGWTEAAIADALTGRSHRSAPGKAKLKSVIDRTRAILDIPEHYRIGIVPASDTGAVEMSLWSMLGARGVDLFAWESFGAGWVSDTVNQLKLEDVRIFEASYGELPDLSQWDADRDIVFTWNGTTSGVRVPNGDWIPDDRGGLTICDATSAVFAMEMPWTKLDVVTWSWQKVMGGEAAHGMIALSSRAVERLETYTPPWPLPKIFRLTKGGKLIEGVFRGDTINTPSMVCVEDALDGLAWGETLGGGSALIARSDANLAAIAEWVARSDWADFLASDPAVRSSTSVCLKIVDPWFESLDAELQASVPKKLDALLEAEGAAFDINGYRDAPPGLRIWAGSTVETSDLEKLFPWLDWAFATVKADLA
ncbi:MAG: phosphoserine transaminase [Pseudomonadota bacterium]|nr:phosphoserine transaminase [Pseudomonadota bacterium]